MDVKFQALPANVASPKLPRNIGGYRYYPGYSRAFVLDVLGHSNKDALVLDPWNGSGTTTTVASELGLHSVGIDLNPAMVVIAKAALLNDDDILLIRRNANDLRNLRLTKISPYSDDPLLEWFDRPSVARVRCLQTHLLGRTRFSSSDIRNLSAAQAFWLTSLFNAVKGSTKAWSSSNPTWIKSRGCKQPAKLYWRQAIRHMLDAAESIAPISAMDSSKSQIVLGSSTDLATHGFSPDLVLGSPPYCTRIDYAMATRVELSVLGLSTAEQRRLRRSLMGTTTVPTSIETPIDDIGATAKRILDAVARHQSKASRSYYWKWLAQYFSNFTSSLVQLSLVTSRSGTIGLVIQDSYYKEIHLDLGQITTEILGLSGWQLFCSYAFNVGRSLAQINPRAVAYGNNTPPPEKALFFRREE